MRFVLPVLLIVSVTPALAGDLTLQRVILSSAGVGYFEYEAKADGDATLGLDVPLADVDDVLNSLVVFDTAGGIGTVLQLRGGERHSNLGHGDRARGRFGPAGLTEEA